jgi:RimJ/RimL family protein N-acetyltransferase
MKLNRDATWLKLPTLAGPRVCLRAFRADDVQAVQEASRDHLIPLITSVPTTEDDDAALEYINRQQDRLKTRAGYSFAIADGDDIAVGQIGLWLRDEDDGRASIGYWIRPSARNRGYATEALETLVVWACTLPQLRRLQLYVEPWNEGSWRAAEHSGFQREGLMRSWQSVGGEPRDMYMYSLLTK